MQDDLKELKKDSISPPPIVADPNIFLKLATGSLKQKFTFEVGDIRSRNYIPGVQGWRLTSEGLEINTFIFPNGRVLLSSIEDISDARILGRAAGSAGPIQQLTAGTGITISGGSVASSITQYTDEMAQDSVGGILTDTETIDLSYNDGAGTITADILFNGIASHIISNNDDIITYNDNIIYI